LCQVWPIGKKEPGSPAKKKKERAYVCENRGAKKMIGKSGGPKKSRKRWRGGRTGKAGVARCFGPKETSNNDHYSITRIREETEAKEGQKTSGKLGRAD